MSPEGIEPPSQEPESWVISITLRRQHTRTTITLELLYFSEYICKKQVHFNI